MEKNYVSVSLCILRNDLMLYMQTHGRLCSLYLAGSIWRWGIFWIRRSTRKLEAPRARSSTAEAAKTAVCDDRRGIARFFFRSPEFASTFERKVPLFLVFWKIYKFPRNTVQDWPKEATMPTTSSIRPAVHIQYRLVTDGQTDTDRHKAIAIVPR